MYRLFIFLIKFKTFIEHDRYYNGDRIDQEIHKWQITKYKLTILEMLV